AMALACGVSEISARAGIHGRREHESGRESDGNGCARDGHSSVLKGLAHDLQNVALKFGQFIQEENSVVAKRHLTRTRHGATSYQPGVADGVMRRAKRTRADEST